MPPEDSGQGLQLNNKTAPDIEAKDAESFGKDLSDIASGAGITFTGKLFSAVIQYVYLIVISKILGVELLGSVLLGMTIISLAGIISRLGLDTGVVKFVAQYFGKQEMTKVRTVILAALISGAISGILISAVLFFSADLLSEIFNGKPDLKRIVQIFGLTIPFNTVMLIALAATQGARIMKYTAYAQYFALHILNLSGVLVFYFLGLKLSGVLGAFVFATIATTGLSLFFLLKTFPPKRVPLAIFEHKGLFSVSIPLGLVFLLSCVILWTDTIMLGYFKSSAEVGVYNTAMKTALFTSLVYASFNAIFTPIIADLYNKKYLSRLETLYKVVAKWIFIITLPLFLIFTLLAREIMQVFGEEFAAGFAPLIVLSFSYLVSAAVGSTGYLLAMCGRHRLVLYNTVGILVFNFFLNYWLIPIFGMNGAAAASCMATVLANCLMVIEVYLLLNMHPFSFKFLKPLLFGSVLLVSLFWAKQAMPGMHYMIQLIVYASVFLFLFSAAVYKWSLSEEDELVMTMIQSKLSKFSGS